MVDDMRKPWTETWSPFLPNGVHRLTFFVQLRSAIEICNRRTTQNVNRELVNRLIDSHVLNSGQIGNLLGISPQHIRNIGALRGGIEADAPKGLFNSYDLDMIYLLVQRLTSGEPPMQWMLEAMPYAGDCGIVSYLSGVPPHIITLYRKSKEASDATDHSQRMAAQYRADHNLDPVAERVVS